MPDTTKDIECLSTTMNWRREFDEKTLKEAEKLLREKDPDYMYSKYNQTISFSLDLRGVKNCRVHQFPFTYADCVQYNRGEGKYHNASQRVYSYNSSYTTSESGVFGCTCRQAIDGATCKHEAALMLLYESHEGVHYEETEEEARARIAAEKKAAKERKSALALESLFPATDLKPDTYYRMDRCVVPLHVSEKNQQQAFKWLSKNNEKIGKLIKPAPDEDGAQRLSLRFQINSDGVVSEQEKARSSYYYDPSPKPKSKVSITLGPDGFVERFCDCGETDEHGDPPMLCAHLFLGMQAMWNHIVKENPGDATDTIGSQILQALLPGNPQDAKNTQKAARGPEVTLSPRLDWTYTTPRIRFSIEHPNGKTYVLRDLEAFTRAVISRSVFTITPKVTLDMDVYRLSDASLSFFNLLESEYGRKLSNRRLLNTSGNTHASAQTNDTGIFLKNAVLDAFYDISQGMSLPCDLPEEEESLVRVGYREARVQIKVEPSLNDRDEVVGISVLGTLPVLLEGATYRYIFTRESFSRVSQKDLEILAPYRQLMKEGECFEGVIGRKNMAAFLYRTLDALKQDPRVQLTDHVSGRVEAELPPRGEYLFLLDLKDEYLTLEATVTYGDQSYPLPVPSGLSFTRDAGLEALALKTAMTYFPSWNQEHGVGIRTHTETALFDLLQNGIADLERFGTVKASTNFPGVQLRSSIRPVFQVSIASGLLDLSITCRDLSDKELLEVLSAYRQKKRYVRLRSGDFVDLETEPPFQNLEDLLASLNLTLEEALQSHAHVPLFRALYVDQLLQDHEELAGSRDRTYRALIKNFKTIRDSDYEVPGHLEDVLRPYQVYGYKWLRTLASAGFGGILADEMGLGKTLQMLAALEAIRAEGETGPSLVVCPASLVYNWKEEAQKFAPSLKVQTLAGTQAERKQLIRSMQDPKHAADLYILSYDIARIDVTALEKVQFLCIILDEAQFIKNTKAGITKAVKVLHASHRFALTGTPIENRLSELWSIFDFLMPGFLYTESEFQKQFEIPITKRHAPEETAQLARMTGPFILRRLKADVLKELPEKMEEVRTALMDAEQRTVYDAQVVHMRQMLGAMHGHASGEDKIKILAEIMRLRQLCCDPSLVFEDYHGGSAKRDMCMDLIESARDGGHRMLLFSQFTSMLSLLESDLKARDIPYYLITGATPKEERLRLVNAFNTDDTPVFLISLRAGGTGLNLTGADVVIHYDPWWNLAVQNQATDRAHRIGQTRQVTVYKLVAAETIEERIVDLQNAKRELADAILSGESTSLMSLTDEELLGLLS